MCSKTFNNERVCVCSCMHVSKGKQGNEPESPFSIFVEKRMLKLNSNRQHPAFKTVALALPSMCVYMLVCVFMIPHQCDIVYK